MSCCSKKSCMDTKTVLISHSLFALSALAIITLLGKERTKKESKEVKTVVATEGPTRKVFSTKAEVSKELCAHVLVTAKKAINERGVFHLAVAGGSLLDALVDLKKHKTSVDFAKVVLSFANHKCVALDDAKSNLAKVKFKFADEAGITRFVTPSSSMGDGTSDAAFYAKALKEANIAHNKDGYPVLDLVLLGLGADGHVGSNHPMGPAVLCTSASVASSPKSGEPSSITLTIESINTAREVGIVVCGGSKGKKEAAKRAMVRPAEAPRGTFPAQLLKSPTFFLDSEAAADL